MSVEEFMNLHANTEKMMEVIENPKHIVRSTKTTHNRKTQNVYESTKITHLTDQAGRISSHRCFYYLLLFVTIIIIFIYLLLFSFIYYYYFYYYLLLL